MRTGSKFLLVGCLMGISAAVHSTGTPPPWMAAPIYLLEKLLVREPKVQFDTSAFSATDPARAITLGTDDNGLPISLCAHRPDPSKVWAAYGYLVGQDCHTVVGPAPLLVMAKLPVSGLLGPGFGWHALGSRHADVPLWATDSYDHPIAVCAVDVAGQRYPGFAYAVIHGTDWQHLECQYKTNASSPTISVGRASAVLYRQ